MIVKKTAQRSNEHPDGICLIPDCGRESQSRGLCGRCYQNARGMILRRETTWEELEQAGLVTTGQSRTVLAVAIESYRARSGRNAKKVRL